MNIVHTSVFLIVIGKFSDSKQPSLIIRLLVDKSLEISQHYTSPLFDLVVSLGVESDREYLLDALKVT